jgi:TetR/AcrR family transcriptional regulator, cholesterol catabolism regulator
MTVDREYYRMIIRSSNDRSENLPAASVTIPVVATPPTKPALRARYDRRQDEVARTAARVFAERGYDQTSVQELTEEIGLAAGGLYHYFPSKEQLLIRICDQLVEPLLERATELLALHEQPEQQLRALVRLWVEQVIEYRDNMLVFQQERHIIERGEQWRGIRSSRKRFERLVEDTLARVQGVRPELEWDPRIALSALLGMINYTAEWYRPRGRLGSEQIADGYVALLLS